MARRRVGHRLHAGGMRPLEADRATLAAGRLGRIRLLRITFTLVLGAALAPGMHPVRPADRVAPGRSEGRRPASPDRRARGESAPHPEANSTWNCTAATASKASAPVSPNAPSLCPPGGPSSAHPAAGPVPRARLDCHHFRRAPAGARSPGGPHERGFGRAEFSMRRRPRS